MAKYIKLKGEKLEKKNRIKHRFEKRINEGKSIRYKDIKEDDPTLLYAIERQFGGIFNASKELGYDEDDLVYKFGMTRNINKKTLTEDEIYKRLMYLKSMGKLTTSAMRTEFSDYRLETSMKKLYGNVRNGLEYFDLERDGIRHTKKSLENRIRALYDEGVELSYTNILKTDSNLLYNANNKFQMGWYDILDSLDIPYEAIRKSFSFESIKERLYRVLSDHGEVNFSLLRKYDSSVVFYAYENYDNIVDFYIDMGLNPNDCMDFSKQTIKGFEFEKTFKELLSLLNIDFIHNREYKDTSLRPDFRLNNGSWIDCKLSSWTSSIESTIEKYTPHCNDLTIVFLRGKTEHAEKFANDKVKIKKVNEYFPFLEKINRHDLIEKFESIKENDFLESVTTERLISQPTKREDKVTV